MQVAQQYNDLLEDYDLRFKVIIGLIALCLLFLFLFINTLLRKGEHGHDGRDYDDRGGRGGREPRDGRSARAGQGGRDSSGDRGKKKERPGAAGMTGTRRRTRMSGPKRSTERDNTGGRSTVTRSGTCGARNRMTISRNLKI